MRKNEITDNNFVSKSNDGTLHGGEVVFEGMTSISAVFHGISLGVTDRRVLRVYFDRERLQKKEKEYRFLKAQSEKLGFSLILTERDALDLMTTGNTDGGIVAVCSERTLPCLPDVLVQADSAFSKKDGFFVYLEGIEDPYNFGYTMRSLYAAGVDGVILPPRNWMQVAGIVARSSAGASEQLPIAIAEPTVAAQYMKNQGCRIVCAGIRDSVSMYRADLHLPLMLVIGGEKRGVSAALLSQCDSTVRIDYGRAFRGSLSAASAATVLAFEVLRQNGIDDTNS